ncbi:uncharacterized mitochondrial protein-like protein [Tanacetum coccineum]
MKSRFQMSSMGELTFFLGLQVKQNKEGIFISQDKYVAEILKKFDLVNVKTVDKVALTKDEEAVDVDVHLYRSMIGSLMYLTASRPDIMYAVSVCSHFQVTPKTSHFNSVKRIFKGKSNLGLWYPKESPFNLEAFSDSDYGGSNLDRKSITGGCQFLGQRLISWQCKKQTIVATSTTEVEYVAAANCCGQFRDKQQSVGFLRKVLTKSAGFAEIVDFLRGSNLSKTKFLNVSSFLQLILNIKRKSKLYLAVNLTKKIFGNMKRGFRGAPRPLLPAMLLVATTNPNAGQEHHAVPQSQPSSSTPPVPSTSSPPVQPSPTPIPASIPTPTPIPETEPEPFEHTFEEPSPVHQHFSPPQEQAHGPMAMDDLLQVVPQLISRIDSLETDLKQTKLTMGNALVKLVKKVKKLEGFLKRRNMVLSDSEEEEPEAQGRKSQDDPLDSSVQGLVTPSTTKVNASGEEQVEDISPNTLEAAKTLSRVASLKPKSIDKGRRYKRRKETKGKKVVSSLDFQEEVDTGAEQVNTAKGVNTGSIKLSTVSEQVSTVSAKKSTPSPDKGQRAGKAPMIIEETPKKSKEQILQEEASLAEAIRLDSLQKEEEAKQIHLDSLLAQRIAEEEELNEQQKKRKAQVQFEAQHYTDEDWDLIRAKIEANAELSKSMLGSDLQGEDFAKKMVDLFAPINFETTKDGLKRFGEELQTETSKRLKSDEAKDDEPTKKSGKKRNQMARKGLHTDLDKDDSEDSDEVSEQDDSVSGTKIPVNPVPVAMKSPKEDGTDIVYINFGAMLKDISIDDLTELYRIVMNRYGMDGPEDELEKKSRMEMRRITLGGGHSLTQTKVISSTKSTNYGLVSPGANDS